MRRVCGAALAAAVVAFLPASGNAQEEQTRAVSGGGIFVDGWRGTVDPNEARRGAKLEEAKFSKEGNDFLVVTGPAMTYWNPANRATGSYMVSATFTEPKYMNLNNHPHPYGIVIGGNDMGTPNESYLYCATYGNGRFIVRGFGPAPFQMNGRGAAHEAIKQAAGQNQPVTQQITVTVTADKVECAVNGTTVASYPKSEVVGEGKLKSTDGIWGVRFGHNTEVKVSGLAMMKH